MRDVVFELISDEPGRLVAEAPMQQLRISATNLEELHHEAREALIAYFGPTHGAYRVRLRRAVWLRRSTPGPACGSSHAAVSV